MEITCPRKNAGFDRKISMVTSVGCYSQVSMKISDWLLPRTLDGFR